VPEPATVAVFAADHGVLAQGISPWPQDVTAMMVGGFAKGGAAINVLARRSGCDVVVVDVGVATPLDDVPSVLRRKVRAGTADLAVGPAMTVTEALLALDVGVEVADRLVAGGSRCLITGEMGIGNTTPSAALIAAITGTRPADATGRGTGIDDERMARKVEIVTAAAARASGRPPVDALAEAGGLEIAALAGLVIGGARARVPVLVDGVIALAATLVAEQLCPGVVAWCIAGHRSTEPAATVALEHLGLEPVLDLGLRLGEGTGATLALPIVQAAARVLNEMDTFET
jgi:nicotinate-nucleotide--dimethylbenzimidazole phosphoribosyltransferase